MTALAVLGAAVLAALTIAGAISFARIIFNPEKGNNRK